MELLHPKRGGSPAAQFDESLILALEAREVHTHRAIQESLGDISIAQCTHLPRRIHLQTVGNVTGRGGCWVRERPVRWLEA